MNAEKSGASPEQADPAELNVRVHRDLVKADPGAHLPDLALSLYAFSSRLSALGRHAESLAAAEEACAISRADLLEALGRTKEAAKLRRKLRRRPVKP